MPFSDPIKKYKKPTDNPDYIDPAALQKQAISQLPDQQRALLQGAGAVAGAVVEHAPGAKSAIAHISDAMNRVEGAAAGFQEWLQSPRSGYHKGTEGEQLSQMAESVKSGSERRASYQEVLGPKAGVLFDIIAPASGVLGEGAGQIMRVAGMPILRTAGNVGGKMVPEGVKDVAALVNKPYAYKRMGIPEGLGIESELAGRSHQADLLKRTLSNKEIKRLVPNPEEAKQLAMAVEDGKMEGLNANQMQAYPLAQREKDLLEQRRISGQTVSKETAAGLTKKMSPKVLGKHTSKQPWQMTEDEFNKAGYGQHILLPHSDARANGIGPEGFKSSGPNVLYATTGPPSNIMQSKYSLEAGKPFYLIPNEWIKSTPNGLKVKDGWIPSPGDVVVPTRSGQSTREAVIANAIRNGETVPESVLREYPNLASESINTSIQYFPHMDLPPQERIASLKKAITEKKTAGLDTSALEGMKKQAEWDAKSRVGQWFAGKRGRPRGFQSERTDLRTLREKGDSISKMNTDVADVLHMGRVETAKAEASRGYMMDYIDALKRKPGNVEDAAWMDNPTKGYTKLDPKYPGMPDNLYVRDDIHKAITGAAQRISNPEAGMLTGIAVFDAGNRLFRNWNLFTRSSTLMNNFVGNVFNNYARLGMGPESVGDYARAAEFLAKKKMGTLDLGAESVVKGMTNGQLSDLLERERITGTGWSHEVGYQRGNQKTTAQKLSGIAGSESVLLEPGKAGFTAIEDWNRAAAYINQLKKGVDPRLAARNVFEAMFDYELGLTSFEKDVMRRIMPFYSWTRFNVPLQLRMFAAHPERYVNMARLQRGASMALTNGAPPVDESKMADWQRESYPMPIGYDPKKGTHMLPLGNITPAAQAAGVFTNQNPYSAMSNLFPTLNPALQAKTNIDWMRSTPEHPVKIQDKPGEKENLLNMNIGKKKAFLAKQLPPIRMAEQARTEYQKAGGGIKGIEAAAKRLTLPYSFTVDPTESYRFSQARLSGQLREWKDYQRKQMRIVNDDNGTYTKDQKRAAVANFNNASTHIQQLVSQLTQSP